MTSKLSLALLLVAGRLAHGDDSSVTATPPDPAASPGFAFLDRFDADGRIGIELGYVSAGSNSGYGRSDLHAHYVEPTIHVGGYAQIQHWNDLGDSGPNDIIGDDSSGTGAPELGALYISRLREDTSLVFRLGVVIPTISSSYDPPDAAAARPNDVFQHFGGATVVRLGVSPLVRRGSTFFRADLGVDASVHMDSNSYVGVYGARLGVGIGTDLGPAALMAEVSALAAIARREQTAIARTTTTDPGYLAVPAVTLRGRAFRFQPYASISAPILFDDLSWAVTVGADVSL